MIRKLWKYRKLIRLVITKLIKYQVIRTFLSDKKFLAKIRHDNESSPLSDEPIMQPHKVFLRRIDTIITKSAPSSTCIIRSLVKRDVLSNYGIKTEIYFGLLREDNEIRAHAWLSSEHDRGYSKVFKVS